MAKDIIVIGGGPAGMMAAIRAGQMHAHVTLLEKNTSLGKKLLLSGKGRCNLTNACDLPAFLQRFPASGAFLRDAFKVFFNRDLMDFFESRGLKLKVERQDRVFPETDRADSILDVLLKELQHLHVDVRHGAVVKDIVVEHGSVKGVLCADGSAIAADRIILATGGMSYPFTGSTGAGFAIAGRLKHTIMPLRPGLVGLETQERHGLEGLTLKNIRLAFGGEGKRIVSDMGELLFTHHGISGPLVLSLSGRIVDMLRQGKKVFAEIDLKPALSDEQLSARLVREFAGAPRTALKNVLKELLPSGMIDCFLKAVRIDGNITASHITKEQRQKIIEALKRFRFDITKNRPLDEAMVTQGGISLKEINPRTMESRLVKGLYFAGEVIDVDADTGGFNLQAAFSTGYLAGGSAAAVS